MAKPGPWLPVGTLVRDARRQVGISQRDLAALLGISHSLVARMELDEDGSCTPAARFAEAIAVCGGGISVHGTKGPLDGEDDGARDLAGRRYPPHVGQAIPDRWWFSWRNILGREPGYRHGQPLDPTRRRYQRRDPMEKYQHEQYRWWLSRE